MDRSQKRAIRSTKKHQTHLFERAERKTVLAQFRDKIMLSQQAIIMLLMSVMSVFGTEWWNKLYSYDYGSSNGQTEWRHRVG